MNAHELRVQKLKMEMRLGEVRALLRTAPPEMRDRLLRERDAVGNEIRQLALSIVESKDSSLSYQTAFLKVSKRLLPKEIFRELSQAANELIERRDQPEQMYLERRAYVAEAIRRVNDWYANRDKREVNP